MGVQRVQNTSGQLLTFPTLTPPLDMPAGSVAEIPDNVTLAGTTVVATSTPITAGTATGPASAYTPRRSGLNANRPAATTYGEGYWYNTDSSGAATNRLDYSNGTTWTEGVGNTGSGGGGVTVWATGNVIAQYALKSYKGVLYIATTAHTAGATFDASKFLRVGSDSDTRTTGRWWDKLAASPSTAKIGIVGDSTSLFANTNINNLLYNTWCRVGMPLEGVTLANIVGGGNNGYQLATWLAGKGTGQSRTASVYSYDAIVADAPDVLILSFLINDYRQQTIATAAAGEALLRQAVESLQADLPNTDIILRIPNSILASNVSGLNYVTGPGGTPINPAGYAQSMSQMMRQAYLALAGDYPHVAVLDTQALTFGTQSFDTTPFMGDQLHPTQQPGHEGWIEQAVLKHLAPPDRRGVDSPQLAPNFAGSRTNRYYSKPCAVSTAGNGFIDIQMRYSGGNAGSWALTTGDVIYFEGITTPLALTSATIVYLNSSTVRLLISGDQSAYSGKAGVIQGSHSAEGIDSRVEISLDVPSIAAGGTSDQVLTVSGASTGVGMGAVAQPKSGGASGLMWTSFVSGTNAVTIRFYNPTGAAIDPPSTNWEAWLVR